MTNNNHYEGGYAPAFMKSRENLCKLAPESISKGSQCNFSNGRFTIESFGKTIEISYPEGQIISQGLNTSFDARLLLLNYLSYAKNVPFSDQWVSYRDLPHGNVFYPNIKKNVIDALGGFFANCDKDILRHSLIEAGFILLQGKADIAAKGFFAPRIPILLHFWEGEEDIPSTCQILFDSSIRDQMHIEDSAALCGIIKNHVINQYTIAFIEAR
ncbi:DUF3786 domain-containing protein [Desulfosporosinus sp. BICA1-9]|uniref:DUF3786 domain-containing protein n=1 Tax=Desulfosporosinus sp. BICA1-9 TaxID=1531958 RepID=UPI00054C0E50|nr:DUF3786 domain-containing protein [Desulfosporosinus sp. BICA1-9]KJS49451.1 MAG: hypothetical protein VR66_08415 [Peptococcaceae bacterium BRH_c23]KJS89252.1 MAG: hypothetical protein JL57_08415 [Desulfosporosinus sp. BICA1-9]